MKRTISKVSLGLNQCRITVKLTSERCEEGTLEARQAQVDMFRSLVTSPDLALCGLIPFQTLRMEHDGECWVMEMEATQYEP